MPSPLAQAILDDLRRGVRAMELAQGDLGEDQLDIAVAGLRASMDAQQDPDGNAWPELGADYAAPKGRAHPGEPTSVPEGLVTANHDMNGVKSPWTRSKPTDSGLRR